MENPRYPDLQLDEDMKLQKREWLVQRIAWVFLYALLAAIVLGVLGNGPLSSARAVAQGGAMEVEFERFMRHRSPETIRLTVHPASDRLSLLFEGNYVRGVEIRKIVPEPEAAIPGMDATVFVFRAEAGRTMQIAFHLQPETVGKLDGWVALEGQPPVALTHFVYP